MIKILIKSCVNIPIIQISFMYILKTRAIESIKISYNPLNINPEKWSSTLKQIVGNLPTICLSVFDHFMNLALKGLKSLYKSQKEI